MTVPDAEATTRWQVGEVAITAIVESQTAGIPPAFMFPTATEAVILRHPWLVPRFADEAGNVGMRVQAFVVQTGGRTVLVDPCVGNGKRRSLPWFDNLQTPFLERLASAGVEPADIDQVLHTHLHVDHVGWDTHLVGGAWVPTFPGARYLYVEPELAWFQGLDDEDASGIRADSVAPVLEAGLADLIAADADLGDGLRLEPTPGHTPGHASLWIESAGEVALITGDVIHHPFQCAEPAIAFVSDDDAGLALTTRSALLARAQDRGALVLGTHFPTSPAGRLSTDGDAWRFDPVDGTPVS